MDCIFGSERLVELLTNLRIMTDTEIVDRVKSALDTLIKSGDIWLFQNNLSEQCITHRLAIYLANLFPEHDVDCEYNGSINNGRKKILFIKEKLELAGLLRESEFDVEQEYIERAVFPDIIIHRRGTNDENLCIIEVKKNTSSVSPKYDRLKLKAYTSNIENEIPANMLYYQLGVFIFLDIPNAVQNELLYFKNGSEVELSD